MDFIVGPLMLSAAEAGDTKRLISTLGYIRNIDFTRGVDMERTALHKAAHRGHKDIVQILVEKGASIEAMDNGNKTPLHLAVRNGHTDTVDLLLMKGASVQAFNEDNSALFVAAQSGYTSTVELLITNGVSGGCFIHS